MRNKLNSLTLLSITLVLFLSPSGLWAKSQVTIGRNFTGSTVFDSGFIPPDTMGAVGENHIVELINGSYSVYGKSNGNLLQSSSLDGFWANAGITQVGSFSYDPRVLYDPFTKRWFAASADNPGNPNHFLVAVSKSSDPTAGWNAFQIQSDPTSTHWADFPTMGINKDGLYLAANMFPVSSGSLQTSILVLPKSDLIAGSIANKTLFDSLNSDNTGVSI